MFEEVRRSVSEFFERSVEYAVERHKFFVERLLFLQDDGKFRARFDEGVLRVFDERLSLRRNFPVNELDTHQDVVDELALRRRLHAPPTT